MKHHIETHGELKSAIDHTEGTKNLWKNFISNNKTHTYKTIDTKTQETKDLNRDKLDDLWSKSDKTKEAKTQIHVIK